MVPDGREQKNRFKHIFVDGWADFKRAHPHYEAVDEVVQKMLGCGEPANGYAVYLCPNCQHRHIVAFSCKSQFCLSCAKVYSQQWVATVQEMLHPRVTYRHLTLSIPEALRALFYQQRAALLSGLMQVAHTTMDAVVAQVKRQTIKLGYIVVLQTALRSATYKGHLHVIMTDGGLCADGRWQRLGYLPYDQLHRTWQQHVLEMIATRLAGDQRAQRLVAEMRRRYPKGFVAYLQGDVRLRMPQLARYLAKYVVRGPMALSRLIAYDQERGTVTVLVSRSSAGWATNRGDGQSGDVYRADGPAYSAQRIPAHSLLWVTGDLHPETSPRPPADHLAGGCATGDGGTRCPHPALVLPGTPAGNARTGSAHLLAVWQ